MNNDDADQKPDWEVKCDELAEKYVFETNGHRWSNNNNECGDNFGSFKAGFNACRAELRAENAELKRRISGHMGAVDIFCERNDKLQFKLYAANAQMEKMGNTLKDISSYSGKTTQKGFDDGIDQNMADEALSQYEQFKKGSK